MLRARVAELEAQAANRGSDVTMEVDTATVTTATTATTMASTAMTSTTVAPSASAVAGDEAAAVRRPYGNSLPCKYFLNSLRTNVFLPGFF